MRPRIFNLWIAVVSSFWFVPGVLLLGGVAMAILMPQVDRSISSVVPSILRASGDTARATLSTLAGAMVTVTGIVFSTTTVAISITAAQHGPRLLRNFFSRPITQTTLGVCLAVSVYCLLLLRVVDEAEGEVFVPQLSFLTAYLFVLAALVSILVFTHHVASLMQTQNVASSVADDLDDSIQRLYPDPYEGGDEEDEDSPAWRECWESCDDDSSDPVESSRDGYVQAIDTQSLVRLASRRDVLLKVKVRPGAYAREADALVRSAPADRLEEGDASTVREAFMIGNVRTPQQDVECAVMELVEIAVRALSPGINDPFTATTCIDRLSGALRRLAQRKPAQALWRDDEGNARLVLRPPMFPDVVDAAFNQIRQHSRSSVSVSVRLLQALAAIAPAVRNAESANALRRQADMVLDAARHADHAECDMEDVQRFYDEAIAALDDSGG